jgi:hypothetical protein
MTPRTRAAAITLVTAVPAFLLTTTLFPPPADMAPTGAQRPLFAVLGAVYAIALGLGVAFVGLGWPWVQRVVPGARPRALAVYLSVAWLLISWYPHGGLHMSNGMDLSGLLGIEYGFHVPLIAAPLALVWGLHGARRDQPEPTDIPSVPTGGRS